MAEAIRERVIHLPTDGDVTSVSTNVVAFWATGAVTVKDAAGGVIWVTGAAAALPFGQPIHFKAGLEKDAGAGELYIYLA